MRPPRIPPHRTCASAHGSLCILGVGSVPAFADEVCERDWIDPVPAALFESGALHLNRLPFFKGAHEPGSVRTEATDARGPLYGRLRP